MFRASKCGSKLLTFSRSASLGSFGLAWKSEFFFKGTQCSVPYGNIRIRPLTEPDFKGPLIDKQFEYDGVTFILPAPSMGHTSEFFVTRRPRQNTSELQSCPPLATTIPDLSEHEWTVFRAALPTDTGLCETFEAWHLKRDRAAQSGTSLRPFAPVTVSTKNGRIGAQSGRLSDRCLPFVNM